MSEEVKGMELDEGVEPTPEELAEVEKEVSK